MFIRKLFGSLLKNSVALNYIYNIIYKIINKKRFSSILSERAKMSIFDYKGLSSYIPYYPMEPVKDSNYYGQCYWVKKYAGLDENLNISFEHGLYYGDYIPYSSYCKTVYRIITFSEVRKRVLDKLHKPVIPIGPYIHYAPSLLNDQDLLNIKTEFGRILLFFPVHSCGEKGNKFCLETIISTLKKISSEYGFQSVFVCMYYYDILYSDYAFQYERAGFKVVTAGHRLDINFLPRLKSIIQIADYTVSNSVGTHTGYCIYMNKTHSLIEPMDYSMMSEDFIEITNAFLRFSHEIDKTQYDVVRKYWGTDLLKTPEELRLLFQPN